MRAKARDRGLILLFCTLLVPFISDGVRGAEASSESTWHVKDAPIRFRIEKNDDLSLIPEVSLLDLPAEIKSESVQKWIKEHRWGERRRFQGKLCQNCLPAFGSNGFKVNLHRDFARFVSRGFWNFSL